MSAPDKKSKCCHANLRVSSSDEGTNCYMCTKCGEPCDFIIASDKKCEHYKITITRRENSNDITTQWCEDCGAFKFKADDWQLPRTPSVDVPSVPSIDEIAKSLGYRDTLFCHKIENTNPEKVKEYFYTQANKVHALLCKTGEKGGVGR